MKFCMGQEKNNAPLQVKAQRKFMTCAAAALRRGGKPVVGSFRRISEEGPSLVIRVYSCPRSQCIGGPGTQTSPGAKHPSQDEKQFSSLPSVGMDLKR